MFTKKKKKGWNGKIAMCGGLAINDWHLMSVWVQQICFISELWALWTGDL